jgi:molybdopterin/thiamine biosynthesis adenylyltransferase
MRRNTAPKTSPNPATEFSQTQRCSKKYAPKFDIDSYLERTKRNHHWLGGVEGQMALQNLRVGVAGLGGMGSNVAEMLVRLGVGHLKIADPDTIEFSNINRQVIANQKTVHQLKAEASANELRTVAEDFELVTYTDGITSDNAAEFVSDLDIVVDEIDVYPLAVHVELHRAARKLNLPIYSGYIIGMGSHIYKFHGDDYTIEDFLQHDQQNIESPTPEFLVDRYVNPPPSYMRSLPEKQKFISSMKSGGVPIFGASTYAAQSMVVIRLISDYLNLDQKMKTQKTPVMPKFIKIDPLDLKTEICELKK